jgi:GT2 family glycosyltransferase
VENRVADCNMDSRSLIIIVTYNSSGFIEECLKSISVQSYKDWQMVLVDNGSTDDTIKKVREFRNQTAAFDSNNFRLIRLKKNMGFAGAVNHAVFKSKRRPVDKYDFRYLVLLNPDVSLYPDALEKLIGTFSKEKSGERPDTGVCGGLVLDYEGEKVQHMAGRITPNFITYHQGAGQDYPIERSVFDTGDRGRRPDEVRHMTGERSNLIEADYVTGAFFATIFSLFYNSGGFDSGYRPVYFEELDYCLRVKEAGWRIVSNTEAVCRHFEGSSSKKFSKKFYCNYHKNRLRCAVINTDLPELLKKFIPAEIKWLAGGAAAGQAAPLLYAYFMNAFFFIFNLSVRLKNHFILDRIELK